MADQPSPSNATAIAGGAIALALFEDLVTRGFLTRETETVVLKSAQSRLSPSKSSPDPAAAIKIIADMLQRIAQS